MEKYFYKVYLKNSDEALVFFKVPSRLMDRIIDLYETWKDEEKDFYYLVHDIFNDNLIFHANACDWGFCEATEIDLIWLQDNGFDYRGIFNLRKEKLKKINGTILLLPNQ